MIIKKAEFLKSVADKKEILDLGMNEFAFVGRSNSGKSSLINSLVNQKKLAKTSSTPGHTKMINYFLINGDKNNLKSRGEDSFILVDLPGYGYSLAGKEKQKLWAELIEDYLMTSKNLKKVFVLVDIRLKPSELDSQMIKFLYFNKIPFIVIATKADKIAKSKIPVQLNLIAQGLKLASGNIIPHSSETGLGKDKILLSID